MNSIGPISHHVLWLPHWHVQVCLALKIRHLLHEYSLRKVQTKWLPLWQLHHRKYHRLCCRSLRWRSIVLHHTWLDTLGQLGTTRVRAASLLQIHQDLPLLHLCSHLLRNGDPVADISILLHSAFKIRMASWPHQRPRCTWCYLFVDQPIY